MSHFAKVVNGIVQQVIVAEYDFFDTYIDNSPGLWIQTSYNTRGNVHHNSDNMPDGGKPLRGNYAGRGSIYDAKNDVFYSPSPYASWILNQETWTWNAPIAYPSDNKSYTWDEDSLSWIEYPLL